MNKKHLIIFLIAIVLVGVIGIVMMFFPPSAGAPKNPDTNGNSTTQPTSEQINQMKADMSLCYSDSDCRTDVDCNGPRANKYFEGEVPVTLMGCPPEVEYVAKCKENICVVNTQ